MIRTVVIVLGVGCLAGAVHAQSATAGPTDPEGICAAKGLAVGTQPYTDCVSSTRFDMNKRFADQFVVVQAKLKSQVADGTASPETVCSAEGLGTGTAEYNSCLAQARQTMSGQASSTYATETSNAQMQSSPFGQGVAH